MHRPARTIVLPEPLPRMLAAYAVGPEKPRRDVGPAGLIPVTNPLERLNREVKRRADAVGAFPNEDSIVRLIGAALLEADDEWQLQNRTTPTEAMAELDAPPIDDPALIATTKAARPWPPRPHQRSAPR